MDEFTEIVTELEENLRQRKKSEGVRYAYKGVDYDLLERSQRIGLITLLVRDFSSKSEQLLSRLADLILDEELSDPNPYKIAHEEYPFMSDRQLDLRRDRETGLKAVEDTGADGRDYRKPTKRRRTNYENWHMDTYSKGRNKARQRQYAKDTAPGPIKYGRSAEFVAAVSVAKTWRERLSLVQ